MTVDRPFVDRPVADIAAATRVAESAAARWGLPQPIPLRRGMNALFTAGDVVLRVGETTALPGLAHQLVVVLAAHGVPTVPPIEGLAAEADGLAVTAWKRIEPDPAGIDWHAVGAAVRRVHELPLEAVPPGYPVPRPSSFPWWNFEGLLADLSGDIDPPALQGLRNTVDRHRGWRTEILRDAVVCHGDVHPGNVLVSGDGSLLIDWDLLCTAAPGWDHAMLTTYAERWGGAPGTYDAFAGGYGASLANDSCTRAIADLRNVAATLMRVRAGRSDPDAAHEAERRLQYWRGDDDAPAWRAQ